MRELIMLQQDVGTPTRCANVVSEQIDFDAELTRELERQVALSLDAERLPNPVTLDRILFAD